MTTPQLLAPDLGPFADLHASARHWPARVVITGGIGCGKSTVAAEFASLGIPTVDCDDLAREALTAAAQAVITTFGPQIQLPMTGHEDASPQIDRAALRRLIFSDPSAKRQLEALIHPQVRAALWRWCDIVGANHPYLIWVIPLFFENPFWHQWVQRIVTVDCRLETQISRVCARPLGLQPQEVAAIIATQAARTVRLASADDIIDTEMLSLSGLKTTVSTLHRDYLQRFAASPRPR